ncbi:MAG: tetratricopeptide repeat protein [Syntrophales bacterium]
MQLNKLHLLEKKALNLHKEYFIIFLLIAMTVISYWQLKNNDFINLDDPQYITENLRVKAGLTLESMKWAFTATYAYNWHPLTWLSHMLDVQLFGLNPGWHHVTNLILHIANTILLFLVFYRMTKGLWQSAFVAALFALHPLHVESVAWASERKDILSALFWILTIGAYSYYAERRVLWRYLLTLLFFILGIMSKPMLVTLPFVLILLDYWPLGRLQLPGPKLADEQKAPRPAKRKHKGKKIPRSVIIEASQKQRTTEPTNLWSNLAQLAREKIPFFIVSAISCVITIVAQKAAVYSMSELPLGSRISNAVVSYADYLIKMILPVNLSVFYFRGQTPAWQVFAAVVFLILVTVPVIIATRKYKYLAVGWFWYLGTLFPVIGIMQVGDQSMADRYTYIPLIGIFVMVAWSIGAFSSAWRNQGLIFGIITGIIFMAFSFRTWTEVNHWRDSQTLFTQALTADTNNPKVHSLLAFTLLQNGHIDEAIQHYEEALRIQPYISDPKFHKNFGRLLIAKGNLTMAISHFQTALQLDPHDAEAREFLAMNKALGGNAEDAVAHYRKALQANPLNPYAHYLLGEALAKHGKSEEAMAHLKEALRIKPDIAEAHNGIGIILASKGKLSEAIHHFREALRIKPDFREASDNLRVALA